MLFLCAKGVVLLNNREIIERLIKINNTKPTYQSLNDLFEMVRNIEEEDYQYAHELSLKIRKVVQARMTGKKSGAYLLEDLAETGKQTNWNVAGLEEQRNLLLLYKRMLLFDAQKDFDSYLQYVEFDRPPEKKFYMPRRHVLKTIAEDLQDLNDRVIDFLGVSLPPRVGKSTLCIFFLTWQMGLYPDKANLMSGHSDKLTKGFYKECLNIIKNPEYLWADVFPNVTFESNSAEDETINLDKPTRFPTLTCRAIEGTLTGAVEAANLLYSDDLVKDREESMSMERMEKKWQDYLNVLFDRKLDGCVELMVGTRWNVYDPLGKIQSLYEGNPRYRFRVIPALNENGESNFVYKFGLGFSTEYFLNIKSRLDDNEWMAKYQGAPYLREGLIFPKSELRFWNGILPDIQPDRIVSVCDVAWGGGDSLAMPFAYIYGEDVYIPDLIFNRGDKEVTRPIVEGKMEYHRPHQTRFEANNGGDEYADTVDKELRDRNVHLNIYSQKAPTTQAKLSRIIQYAPDIKRFHFLEESKQSVEYRKFMLEVTTISAVGKNAHDDAPDSLAMLADLLTTAIYAEVKPMKRPY